MLIPIDIVRVLSHYDLGSLKDMTRAHHGYVNETVFVETTRGRFAIRRNHRRYSEETLRYHHKLIKWLCKRGFAVPCMLPARDGDTLLTLDGRTYEVMPMIDGNDYNPGHPQQLTSIGETLARYHHTIDGFPSPPADNDYEIRYSPQNIMALTECLLERDIMGELYDDLMWYDMRAAHLRSVISDEAYAKLPHVVIHGDVHRDNFLFVNDEVVALLDYDQATWDARICDLADALVGFATAHVDTKTITWGVYKGPLDIEQATQIVAAYHAITPLTAQEIAVLPLMVEMIWLQGELGRVVSTPEGAPDYHLNVLEQGRKLSKWMEEHTELLISRWANLPVSQRSRITAQAA